MHRDLLVPIEGSLLQAGKVVGGSAFAFRGAGKEQVFTGVFPRQESLRVGDGDDFAHRVDSAATARSGARQYHSPNQVGRLECHHLCNGPAEGEPDQIHLRQSERSDERNRVVGHLVDVVRHYRSGGPNASVVERDDTVVRRDAVDHSWVPVVEHGGEVMQEHHGHVGFDAELPECERHSVDVDCLGGRVFPGEHVKPLGAALILRS